MVQSHGEILFQTTLKLTDLISLKLKCPDNDISYSLNFTM